MSEEILFQILGIISQTIGGLLAIAAAFILFKLQDINQGIDAALLEMIDTEFVRGKSGSVLTYEKFKRKSMFYGNMKDRRNAAKEFINASFSDDSGYCNIIDKMDNGIKFVTDAKRMSLTAMAIIVYCFIGMALSHQGILSVFWINAVFYVGIITSIVFLWFSYRIISEIVS